MRPASAGCIVDSKSQEQCRPRIRPRGNHRATGGITMKFAALHRTRLAVAVSAAALSLAAGHALGSNFALQEQSGSGVGNAFAGGAAAAEDASTVWSNPAGMSRIPGIQG